MAAHVAAFVSAVVHPPTAILVLLLILAHHVDDLIGDAEVLDIDAADVHLGHPPEAVTVLAGANDLAKLDVHPVVTLNEVAIVRLAVLQLHEHRVVLGRTKERQWQHCFSGYLLLVWWW